MGLFLVASSDPGIVTNTVARTIRYLGSWLNGSVGRLIYLSKSNFRRPIIAKLVTKRFHLSVLPVRLRTYVLNFLMN